MIDFAPIGRFGLVLVRPAMLVASAPPFGGAYAPRQVRVGLAMLFAFILAPTVAVPDGLAPVALFVVVLREMAIGLAMGLAVRALIGGAEMAGNLSGTSLGLMYAAIVDPASGVRNNTLTVLYGNLALLVFFATNGHHALIRGMAASYAAMPIGVGHIDPSLLKAITGMLGVVFVLGVRLAMPIVVVLLIVELAMGLVARAAPGINLMVVAQPVRLLVGLLVLASVIAIAPGVIGRFVSTALTLGAESAQAFR